MNKIISAVKEHSLKPKMPEISADEYSITVDLFSTKEKFEKKGDTTKDTIKFLSKNEKIILVETEKNPKITAEELSLLLNINIRNTKINIKKLKEKKLLKRIGPRKSGHWEVIKK